MSVQAISAAFAVQGVTPSEKLVLLALANYADAEGRCWPSQSRLARDTGLTDRQIRRVFVSLMTAGLMSKQERRRPDGYRASDVITLTISPDTMSGSVEPHRTFQPDLTGHLSPISPDTMSGPTTLEPSENHQIEPSVERTLMRAAHTDGFERFWSAYPSKVGKRDAEKAFAKAVKRIDSPDPPAVMLTAIERAAQGRRWLEGYIPNPSTWLNQDRWEDQPDERSDHQLQRPTDARRADTESRRDAWAEEIAERNGLQPEPDDGGTPRPDGNGLRYLRLAHTG